MTTAIVAGLAIVVAVLGLLVAGLLRSHAEIVRALSDRGVNLDPQSQDLPLPVARPGLPPVDAPGAFPDALDIIGTTLSDDTAVLGVSGPQTHLLLAFLSSQCLTCRDIWRSLADPSERRLPGGAEVVVVVKGPDQELAGEVERLASEGLTVIMSTEAWQDYEVPVSPYFVHVYDGRVAGTGAAATWRQVTQLVETALRESDRINSSDRIGRPVSTGHHGGRVEPRPAQDRAEHVDAALAAAGILPGDPRLWPGAGQHVR